MYCVYVCMHIFPPLPLPSPLQVLLSQTHRFQALELLGRFLDLGPWAVSLALSVGIFPYVLKLLQSKNKELQPILVFIWSKILAVDKVRGFLPLLGHGMWCGTLCNYCTSILCNLSISLCLSMCGWVEGVYVHVCVCLTCCSFFAMSTQSCQADLCKENNHLYFVSILSDFTMQVRMVLSVYVCLFHVHRSTVLVCVCVHS